MLRHGQTLKGVLPAWVRGERADNATCETWPAIIRPDNEPRSAQVHLNDYHPDRIEFGAGFTEGECTVWSTNFLAVRPEELPSFNVFHSSPTCTTFCRTAHSEHERYPENNYLGVTEEAGTCFR